MAAKGVRIAPAQAATPPAMRRRPRQSRARASSQALQEAFVRVLLDGGCEKTTVREVVAVAGVGVGTFYEYFGNMPALAALVVHQHVKALAQVVAAQLHAQVAPVLGQAVLWARLFALERQVSPPEAFARQYEAWVELWRAALAAAHDAPRDAPAAARMLHSMAYGSVSQALLSRGAAGGQGAAGALLRAELERAAQAYAAALPRESA